MRRATRLLATGLLTLVSAASGEASENSFWIRLLDQEARPIPDATVFYCIDDCILERSASNRRQAATNDRGLAELHIGGDESLRIQGISKEGFDIRLGSIPWTAVRLRDPGRAPIRTRHSSPWGWTSVRYGRDVAPYSMPASDPLLTFAGWKLGPATCLERGRDRIDHERSEAKWEIRDARTFYKVGGDGSVLERGGDQDFDFAMTISRSRYPWRGLLNSYLASYRLEIEFRDGGARRIRETEYPHRAPDGGYESRVSERLRGLGDVSGTRQSRWFIKVGERYGVLNLDVIPSQRVFFEYLLNREEGERRLDVRSHVGERGATSDYFACPGAATIHEPRSTAPGECADLGDRRIGC